MAYSSIRAATVKAAEFLSCSMAALCVVGGLVIFLAGFGVTATCWMEISHAPLWAGLVGIVVGFVMCTLGLWGFDKALNIQHNTRYWVAGCREGL